MEEFRQLYEESVVLSDENSVAISCDMVTAGLIETTCKTRGVYSHGNLVLTGSNALDFLAFIYPNEEAEFSSRIHYNRYIQMCHGSKQHLELSNGVMKHLEFKFVKLISGAVSPFKERASDSGYDLTLIKLLKQVGNTYWYTTGISVQPPNGYYFDVVPRSSISKTGFMLTNSVGIIDRAYTGDIIVVLTKVDLSAPDLSLPFRAVQMIPRSIVHMFPKCVESLSDTQRADGGFGSTN
jgi:dUTP pyrophosphatase